MEKKNEVVEILFELQENKMNELKNLIEKQKELIENYD
jgi:hypothetical protein